jgi:O-antigen ligase
VVAAACLSAAVAILLHYPLRPWLFGIALSAYGAVLWRWPGAWLVVVPTVLPSLDLSPLTGWMMIGEADLFILVTIGVLAVRAPPLGHDFWPPGRAGKALAIATAALLIGIARGIWSLPGIEGGSDLAYLRPDNALRVGKGFLTALILLPFLRSRHSSHGDAIKLLAFGMMAGLSLVAAQTFAERVAFSRLFDLSSLYPASGPFASMHVGGDHLGAYIAIALPFALIHLRSRDPWTLGAARAVCALASYALIVTFSAVVYGAALIGVVVTWLATSESPGESGRENWLELAIRRNLFRTSYVGVLAITLIVALVGFDLVHAGLERVAENLINREHDLRRDFSLWPVDPTTGLLGAGTGSFGRIVAFHDDAPSNFVVAHDETGPYLSLMTGPAFYIGQKVSIKAGYNYKLSLSIRSPDGNGITTALLCEKHLLSSTHCQGREFTSNTVGKWQTFSADLPTANMTSAGRFWPFAREVELSLFVPRPRTVMDLKDVTLTGPHGEQLLANGDFSRGVERWYFTDEAHADWQIMNQYLMVLFEGGVIGLVGFVVAPAAALLGAYRQMRRGDFLAPAVAAALMAFLLACGFDSPLVSSRLSTLFYLTCGAGLLLLEESVRRAYLVRSAASVLPTSGSPILRYESRHDESMPWSGRGK